MASSSIVEARRAASISLICCKRAARLRSGVAGALAEDPPGAAMAARAQRTAATGVLLLTGALGPGKTIKVERESEELHRSEIKTQAPLLCCY